MTKRSRETLVAQDAAAASSDASDVAAAATTHTDAAAAAAAAGSAAAPAASSSSQGGLVELSSTVQLPQQGTAPAVSMPWVGFGTYKLSNARAAVRTALRLGYRALDSAYIYGGEKTEPETGAALAAALEAGEVTREEVFVTTKHWRKFHGYEPSLACLKTSLRRLQLAQVDLWLMHWPGPAWRTMNRRKDEIAAHGPFHYAAAGHEEDALPALRAETWRAMEDALEQGLTRAIGVSNFSVRHLQALKQTARVWPPAVNQAEGPALRDSAPGPLLPSSNISEWSQELEDSAIVAVELNPYYQQRELQAYCAEEGIVLQARAATTASLGGPLLEAPPVAAAAEAHGATAAQAMLRWANTRLFHFSLSEPEMAAIDSLDRGEAGRTCWRNDPLRMLQFE
ncbi:hypothetical protein EMIHUDRAFT_453168, partial [Emiliania huxleyi CCMP1516]|uniref:NADP-dependent oxidoreductase domain-containing protein n=2 Tax=Emiliania huxleyi TaxID=2903 RepID=A0A0D3IA56_EMIH1